LNGLLFQSIRSLAILAVYYCWFNELSNINNQSDSSLLSNQENYSLILPNGHYQDFRAFYLVTFVVDDYIHKIFDSLLKLFLKPIENYQWLKEGCLPMFLLLTKPLFDGCE